MVKNMKSNIIKNYKIREAFVQLDFLDGFSYIDRAGEIVDAIVRKDKKIPEFNMSINGMNIKNIDDIIPELKVSPTRIWIHFVEPKNLGNIHSKAIEVIDSLIKVLKPTMIERVGWRTYFTSDERNKTSRSLQNFKISDGLLDFEVENFSAKREYEGYDLRLEVRSVADELRDNYGSIIYDFDFGKKKQNDDKKIEILQTLDDIHEKLKSDELLKLLDGISSDV